MMHSDAEVIGRLLAEDQAFQELLKRLPDHLHAQADYLYQEGVRVADIEQEFAADLMPDAPGPQE